MLEHIDFTLGSMYGDFGFVFPFDTATGVGDARRMQRAFLGGGMMLSPDRKPEDTTISALITLTSYCNVVFRLGLLEDGGSGSASFQSVKKSCYALRLWQF